MGGQHHGELEGKWARGFAVVCGKEWVKHRIDSLNNSGSLWGIMVVPGFLVPSPGVMRAADSGLKIAGSLGKVVRCRFAYGRHGSGSVISYL